jgi:Ion channel
MKEPRDALPRHRTGRFVAWLDRSSLCRILTFGLAVYSIGPVTLSFVELACASAGDVLVKDTAQKSVLSFWDLLYFNFTTILTVGYGDFVPVSAGRLLSVAEAIFGLVLFGAIISVAMIKVMLPPKNAVEFSKYGYYCTEEEQFLVIFVNTTSSFLVNPEMCSYYRQGDDWTVRPAYRAPVIKHSVWTFFIAHVTTEELISGPDEDNCLRFGITGQLGLSSVSAYVEYEPENILVIPNRQELVTFKGFRNANLASKDLRDMFHYHPKGSESLKEFVRRKKLEANGGQA